MKRFLIQSILIIILPLTILLGGIELFIRNISNDYNYKHEWLTANNSQIEVLCLGSSHGYFGIKPDMFSKYAFNLAFTSQSLKYDKYLYDAYASQCHSLNYLILPISYFSMRSDLETSTENWRIKGYSIYMGCDFHQYELFYNLEIASKDKLRAIYEFVSCDTSFVNCDSLGWGTNYKLELRNDEWQKTGLAACQRHTIFSHEYVEDNKQYLKDIIDDCVKRDIKVILLTTPTHKSYFELLDANQLNEMNEICNRFDDKHENVVYLNWLKNDAFTDEDFFDADHLNEYGAEKLTKMLDEYIMNWQ